MSGGLNDRAATLRSMDLETLLWYAAGSIRNVHGDETVAQELEDRARELERDERRLRR